VSKISLKNVVWWGVQDGLATKRKFLINWEKIPATREKKKTLYLKGMVADGRTEIFTSRGWGRGSPFFLIKGKRYSANGGVSTSVEEHLQ